MMQRNTYTLHNHTNTTACLLKQVVVPFSYNTCLSSHFQQLENMILSDFIPTLTGNPALDDLNRELFALLTREGGFGLINPASKYDSEYISSRAISKPLVEVILDQKNLQIEHAVECLRSALPPARRRAMELASEKGASSWLTTLPIEEFGFCLCKGAFADALALRYIWTPSHIPMSCVSLSHSRVLCLWVLLHSGPCPLLPKRRVSHITSQQDP